MSMLKGLKNKKDGKGDTKKDKKEKEAKKEVKKVKEQQQEMGDPLVDMSEFDTSKEESKTSKKINKIQSSKLQQKQIDTSNIVVQKKQEKKPMSTWVVNENQISKTFSQKFDMNKVDTQFSSLTDQKLNKELQKKAKKEAEENKNKPIKEEGGLKFAPLQKAPTSYVDANELSFNRKPQNNITTGIPIASSGPPVFTNSSNQTKYVALQKTAQQLKEEAMEKKLAEVTIAPKKQDNWLGKKNEPKPTQEVKLSGWAAKAVEQGDAPTAKYAKLEKSQAQKRYQRQQQQFVYTSKKDIQERKKKREQKEKTTKA